MSQVTSIFLDIVVKLVGWGSVINKATQSSFFFYAEQISKQFINIKKNFVQLPDLHCQWQCQCTDLSTLKDYFKKIYPTEGIPLPPPINKIFIIFLDPQFSFKPKHKKFIQANNSNHKWKFK